MSTGYQIVVCGSIVPDPLQTLEPIVGPAGPALKNEMMLPSVLDPWAWHSLFEAAHLAKSVPGSKVYLVSVAPKAKLQQVMMSVGQKAPFELIAVDGPASGFTDAAEIAPLLTEAIKSIPLFEGMHRFFPTLLRYHGYMVVECPVSHRPRVAGVSKYGVLNRVFKSLRDLFAVRWMRSRLIKPPIAGTTPRAPLGPRAEEAPRAVPEPEDGPRESAARN